MRFVHVSIILPSELEVNNKKSSNLENRYSNSRLKFPFHFLSFSSSWSSSKNWRSSRPYWFVNWNWPCLTFTTHYIHGDQSYFSISFEKCCWWKPNLNEKIFRLKGWTHFPQLIVNKVQRHVQFQKKLQKAALACHSANNSSISWLRQISSPATDP